MSVQDMETSRLTNLIESFDVAALASQLVKIPSYSFMKNQENEIANYILERFKSEGIEAELQEALPGRPNVIAKIAGSGGGKSLMLCGHMDTVPAYDMKDPFSGKILGGKVYGRGSCDMKGALAAMIAVMHSIKKSGIQLRGDLIFAGLVDEEEDGKGAEVLVKNNVVADAVIVGEGTNLDIGLGHKGLEWIIIEVTGKKVHVVRQQEGVNAIEVAGKLITEICGPYRKLLESRKHEILGMPTLNIGTIEGGDQPSTVADFCVIKMDRTYVPGETSEKVYRELEEIADRVLEQYPGAGIKIRNYIQDYMPHDPFFVTPDEEIVKTVQCVSERLGYGRKDTPTLSIWTDAGTIAGFTNSKCVICGPGNLMVAHSIHEYVEIAELKRAAMLYAMTAVEFCK